MLTCFVLYFADNRGAQYEMLTHLDYFKVHDLFSVADLFNARVHYGHTEGTLDDRMKPYIYGKRMGHIIFDLDKTAKYLRNALNFAAHVAYRDGVILFVSRQPEHAYLIESTAEECKEFAHTRYWRGGIFTNSVMQYKDVTRLPDLCIFLNTLNDVLTPHIGLKDASKMLVPVIGVCDSNCNPNLITYPVPGNDDSLASMELYCKVFKEAILRGKQKRKEHIAAAKRAKGQPEHSNAPPVLLEDIVSSGNSQESANPSPQ